ALPECVRTRQPRLASLLDASERHGLHRLDAECQAELSPTPEECPSARDAHRSPQPFQPHLRRPGFFLLATCSAQQDTTLRYAAFFLNPKFHYRFAIKRPNGYISPNG